MFSEEAIQNWCIRVQAPQCGSLECSIPRTALISASDKVRIASWRPWTSCSAGEVPDGDVVYSLRDGGLEQKVGHDHQGLVEKFREAVRASRSVEVQSGPPFCGMVPREQ